MFVSGKEKCSPLRGDKETISKLLLASFPEQVLVQNFSYKNEIDLHKNDPAWGTQFHMDGFTDLFCHRLRQYR